MIWSLSNRLFLSTAQQAPDEARGLAHVVGGDDSLELFLGERFHVGAEYGSVAGPWTVNGIGVPPTGASNPEVWTVARILKSRTWAGLDVPLPSRVPMAGTMSCRSSAVTPSGAQAHAGAEGLDFRVGSAFHAGKFFDRRHLLADVEVGESGVVERQRTSGHQALQGALQGKLDAGGAALQRRAVG